MKSKNITHSKIKNPGILYELLVRQITVDIFADKKDSPALNILREYFGSSTELGKELQLYRSFFESDVLSELKASKFVDLVATQRSKLNEKKLLEEKYNLIKNIKDHYNLDTFLNVKIPSYKLYASIYKTFLAEVYDFDVTNIKEVATSRFTIIEHLIKDKSPSTATDQQKLVEIFRNQTEDLRMLTYKIMLDKFNQKYSNLNQKQKMLLREYINSVSNSDEFKTYVIKQIKPLQEELMLLAVDEDPVLNIKINEVASQLDIISNRKKIKDKDLTALMIAYQIVEELSVK